MPSIILYSIQSAADLGGSDDFDHWPVFVRGSRDRVWVRAEIHPGDLLEALAAAKPRDGETVLNTIPLPSELEEVEAVRVPVPLVGEVE